MHLRTNWNSVLILTSTQALFQTASILVMVLSGVVGLELAPDKSIATLPIAMISVGTAVMMIPASFIIRKAGQKKGFMLGAFFGISSGLLSFYGILHHSFPIFIFGNTLLGCNQAFVQYYRFAAADSVPVINKGKAISFVIAGGVVAAIAGPNLAKYTQHLGSPDFAYSFLSLTFLSIIALTNLAFWKTQKTTATLINSEGNGRPLMEIIKKRETAVALSSSAVGYSVMILVMTATPLAMRHCGHSLDASASVIQYHVLGMFVPSFFTGNLIARFGSHKIILIGILLLFAHVTLALSGTDFLNFVSGLILLGIGWNFMFIGGSTLLTKVYRNEEKEKAQAFHDFAVFLVISLSSFSAGTLLNHWGWRGVNLAAIPILFLSFMLIVLSIRRARN